MTTPARPATVEGYSAQHLGSLVAGMAERLRALAERVDRHRSSLGEVGQPGWSSYADVVGRIQHDVLWGLANLSLDALTHSAIAADTARQRGIAAEKIAAAIDATVGGYPDVPRPKVDRGEHLNDAAWAAQIARDYGTKEG